MSEVDEVRQAVLESLCSKEGDELVEMFHIDVTTLIEEEVERRINRMSVRELLEVVL